MTKTRSVLLFSCAASVTLAQLVAAQFADPDLWGRLSVGAVLDEAGFVPTLDDFSFTARGEAWIDHEWLTGVVFHRLLQAFGEAGLLAFKYAAVLACLALVFFLNRWVYGASVRGAAWACGLLSPLVAMGFASTVRAQVFSFVFFMLFLAALEVARTQGPKRWLVLSLLPAGVVWGNLHGGVAMGLILLAIHAVARLVERRAADAAVLAGVAAGILLLLAVANPYGPRYLAFLVEAWTLDRDRISEWAPLFSGRDEWRIRYAQGLAIAACALGVLGLWRARRPDTRDGVAPSLVLLQVASMSLVSIRIVPFLALATAALLPCFAAQLAWRPRLPERRWLRFALDGVLPVVATFVALSALPLAGKPWLAAVVPDETAAGAGWQWRYPVGAVHFLQASPYQGSILNRFNDGEFLLWNLYPRFRVAVDGRYEEVYPPSLAHAIEDFFKAMGARSSEEAVAFADRSGADFILFRARTPTLPAVERDPDWIRIYDDGLYVILARASRLPHAPLRPRQGVASRPSLLTLTSFVEGGEPDRFARYPKR